jgi:hypothetical protein
MPECSVCGRSYDDRFKVFVPPHPEAFDTVECARRAARAWGAHETGPAPIILPAGETLRPVPIILPAVETLRPVAERTALSARPRRSIAALTALAIVPGQAALAGGIGLLAGGTAASVYLAARPSSKAAHSVVAGPARPGTPSATPPASITHRGLAPSEPAASGAVTRPPDSVERNFRAGVRHARATFRRAHQPVVIANTHTESDAPSPAAPASSELISRNLPTAPVSPRPHFKPRATPKPNPQPAGTWSPKPGPTEGRNPKPKPEPTGTRSPKPKPEPEPTGTRSPKPTPTPTKVPPSPPTATAGPEPVPQPEPTPAPTAEPQPEPTPAPTAEPSTGQPAGAGPTAVVVAAPAAVESAAPDSRTPQSSGSTSSNRPSSGPPTEPSPPPEQPAPPPSTAPTPPPEPQPTTSNGNCHDGHEDDHGDDSHGDARPGNGWGDRNHDHSGPPGRDGYDSHDDHGQGHGHDGHGRGR